MINIQIIMLFFHNLGMLGSLGKTNIFTGSEKWKGVQACGEK